VGALEGNGFNGTRKVAPFKAKKVSRMKPEEARRRKTRHSVDDAMLAKEYGISVDEMAD